MLKANVGAPELVEGPGEVLGVPSNDEREVDKEMIHIKCYGEQIHDLIKENNMLEIIMVNQRRKTSTPSG